VCKTVGVVLKHASSQLLPDPYCIISVGSTVIQTSTVKSTLNPTWDETFQFDTSHSLRYATVEVWDGSSHAKPTFMGTTMVPLFHMAAGGMHRKVSLRAERRNEGERKKRSHDGGSANGVPPLLPASLAPNSLQFDSSVALASLPLASLPLASLPLASLPRSPL
jgi:hypothetical protein